MTRNAWYVYDAREHLVLCGHKKKARAALCMRRARRSRQRKDIFVLARDHGLIHNYARTHPAFAMREKFGIRYY